MPLEDRTHPALPQNFPNDEAESQADYEMKRAALGRLIDEGDASGIFDGDIFESVARELGLDLDEDVDNIQ